MKMIEKLRLEVIKMIKRENMFDVLITQEEGKGSHCIFCPVCFYTDILLLGKKRSRNWRDYKLYSSLSYTKK